jgi:hypothetical protein
MMEVTGYNNKTPQNDGETMVRAALMELEKIFSP